MRGIEAAGIDEAEGDGEVGADEGGEVIDVGERDGAAYGRGHGSVSEGVHDVGAVSRVGEKDFEAVDFGAGKFERLDQSRVHSGSGGGGCGCGHGCGSCSRGAPRGRRCQSCYEPGKEDLGHCRRHRER